MHPFSTPRKHGKPDGFLMFSGGREGALRTNGLTEAVKKFSEVYSKPC